MTTVLDPTDETTATTREPNPRLESLDGRTIGLLDISNINVPANSSITIVFDVTVDPAAQIGDIIAKDMGMTAKVLQLVNSAFFGLRNPVSSPSQAVSLLGLDVITALVLTTKAFSQLKSDSDSGQIDLLWHHSARVGSLAMGIS